MPRYKSKTYIAMRRFLQPSVEGDEVAYVYGTADRKTDWVYGEFGIHDGVHTVHLHFDLDSLKEVQRGIRKVETLELAAREFKKALVAVAKDLPEIKKERNKGEDLNALLRRKDLAMITKELSATLAKGKKK